MLVVQNDRREQGRRSRLPSWRNRGDNLSAQIEHMARPKASFGTSCAHHNNAGTRVDEDTHGWPPLSESRSDSADGADTADDVGAADSLNAPARWLS